VGISTHYPPLTLKEDGEIQGIEADLARQLGEELGRPVKLIETPWERLIPDLLAGRIDIIMSGMSVTDERSREIDFVQPYMRVGQMALIRMRDAARLSRPTAMYARGLRVGYKDNTTGAAFVRNNLTQAVPVGFATPEQGIAALRAGKIDVFIHDAPTVWRVGNAPMERELIGVFRPLTEEYLAWGVRKSDPALKRQLDEVVSGWKRSGRLQAILNQWIVVSVEVK
jgi:polar amino acid transport system substrate-binding protein